MKVYPIPEEFLKSSIRTRKLSDLEQHYRALSLSAFRCPACGSYALTDAMQGDDYDYYYNVHCDVCGWGCPVELLSDCGEALSEFKSWMAAWTLMRRPAEFTGSDCTKFFDRTEHKLLEYLSKEYDKQADSKLKEHAIASFEAAAEYAKKVLDTPTYQSLVIKLIEDK